MLIEAVVSLFLLAIALSMTVIIVGVLTKNVANTNNKGTSVDTAQSSILSLSSYLQGAVSPVAAANAEVQPGASGSTCWGSSNIAVQEGLAADGWQATSTISLNESVGVVFAHDFAMEFCGYGSDSLAGSSTTPNVYEIFVNTTSGSCTANNYCPVDVVNFGNGSYSQSEYAPSSPLSQGSLAATIGRVWCDKACQQLGVSCQSIDTAINKYSLTMPANYTSLCPAGYAGTPPLFKYYTASGVGSGGISADPLNWMNAYTNNISNPQNVNTSNNSDTCISLTSPGSYDVASCGPMDMYSPSDEQTMQAIQDVVLDMTIISQDTSPSTTAKSTSVELQDQVWLRNLTS